VDELDDPRPLPGAGLTPSGQLLAVAPMHLAAGGAAADAPSGPGTGSSALDSDYSLPGSAQASTAGSSWEDGGSGGGSSFDEGAPGVSAAAAGPRHAKPPEGRQVVVEIKTTNALPLLKYACTPRVVALPTAQINASRVRGGGACSCAGTASALAPSYLLLPAAAAHGVALTTCHPAGAPPPHSRPLQLGQLIKRPYASMVSQALLNFESATNVFVMPPHPELEGCR
jgi:hypothetical protein